MSLRNGPPGGSGESCHSERERAMIVNRLVVSPFHVLAHCEHVRENTETFPWYTPLPFEGNKEKHGKSNRSQSFSQTVFNRSQGSQPADLTQHCNDQRKCDGRQRKLDWSLWSQ